MSSIGISTEKRLECQCHPQVTPDFQIKMITLTGVKINSELIMSVLAFADDIVLLAENPDLQKLISIVQKWSAKWRFIINPEKTQIIHYRNAPQNRTVFEFELQENGPYLQVVDSYKYLGVYLDEYLTFSHTTDFLATAGGRALDSMINKECRALSINKCPSFF